MSSAHQNEALVRRLFEEVWNQDRMDVAKEILHEDYRSSENITFASHRGVEVLAADIDFYREMYSDLNFQVESIFSKGDTVVTAWQATGVANREFFTDRSGNERNKSLQAEGVSVSKIVDHKIVESPLYWPRYPFFP